MIQNFKLEDIGTSMPYTSPDESFFAELENDICNKAINSGANKNKRSRKLMYIISSVAAVLAVAFIALKEQTQSSNNEDINILEQDIDYFLSSLSDTELDEISTELDFENEFYNYLP